MYKVYRKAKIEGYKGVEPIGLTPFVFVKMINSQYRLPLIEINESVYEQIKNGHLASLPIHCSQGVSPGNLICFQPYDSESDLIDAEWSYALVTSTEYNRNGLTFAERVSFLLTRFDVVADLSGFVIS